MKLKFYGKGKKKKRNLGEGENTHPLWAKGKKKNKQINNNNQKLLHSISNERGDFVINQRQHSFYKTRVWKIVDVSHR